MLRLGGLVTLGAFGEGPPERIVEPWMRGSRSHAPLAVDRPVDAAHLLLLDLDNGPELLQLLLALARASAVNRFRRAAQLVCVACRLPVHVRLVDGSGARLHRRDGRVEARQKIVDELLVTVVLIDDR